MPADAQVVARVVDLEDYRTRLLEAHAAEHGPLRFLEVSVDGDLVVLELGDGESIELSPEAAAVLSRRLGIASEALLLQRGLR